MPYLKNIRLKPGVDTPGEFPFTIPVIETFESLDLSAPVTFLVGENGSGKSTFLEAIAAGMRCPTVGATDISADPMMVHAVTLARHLVFSRERAPRHKLFFRAEDAIGFTRRLKSDMAGLAELEEHFDKTLSGYGKLLATGAARGQLDAIRNRYGTDPDARSHGEWFIEMLKTRLHDHGLYLLDEPETPLSPIHQLSLLSIVKEQVDRDCQFIIATHSPILMALPGAQILQFDQRISPIGWEDVEHVAITRAFLNDPQSFLRHL